MSDHDRSEANVQAGDGAASRQLGLPVQRVGALDRRDVAVVTLVAALFVLTGVLQNWVLALTILNMAIISAIMALGVNIQWGYAGLFNVGTMGFVALGGLAAVLVSMPGMRVRSTPLASNSAVRERPSASGSGIPGRRIGRRVRNCRAIRKGDIGIPA